MAAILDLCVKIMFKLQNDVIVINLVVDLSKRGSSHMTQCVLLQKLSFKLFFKLVLVAILDLALRRKMQGFLGGTCDLFCLQKVPGSRISHTNMLVRDWSRN